MRSAINDYMYNVTHLEQILMELFGLNTRILDYHAAVPSGTKVAITAATDKPPTARLFTNYNGLDPFSKDCGWSKIITAIQDVLIVYRILYRAFV